MKLNILPETHIGKKCKLDKTIVGFFSTNEYGRYQNNAKGLRYLNWEKFSSRKTCIDLMKFSERIERTKENNRSFYRFLCDHRELLYNLPVNFFNEMSFVCSNRVLRSIYSLPYTYEFKSFAVYLHRGIIHLNLQHKEQLNDVRYPSYFGWNQLNDYGLRYNRRTLWDQSMQKEPLPEQPMQKQALQKQPLQRQLMQKQPLPEQPMQEQPLQKHPLQTELTQKQPLPEKPMQKQAIQDEPMQKQAIQDEPMQKQTIQDEPMQKQVIWKCQIPNLSRASRVPDTSRPLYPKIDDITGEHIGHNFEQCMLSVHPDIEPMANGPVYEAKHFNLVHEAKLNNHRILYAAEIDGIIINKNDKQLPVQELRQKKRDEILNDLRERKFVELKTFDKNLDDRRMKKIKIIETWAQTFFAGVDTIVIGVRNHDGIIQYVNKYPSSYLLTLGGSSWDPDICISFCDNFLNFVKKCFEEEILKLSDNLSAADLKEVHIQLNFTKQRGMADIVCETSDKNFRNTHKLYEWFF